MPETVTFDEDLGIVRIVSHGDITVQDLTTSLASALKIHQQKGTTRGFVDATGVTSYPSSFNIHDFGTQAVSSLKTIRVAIAVPPGLFNAPGIFETVVRNRGANLRIFDSTAAALAWLIRDRKKGGAK